jgi:hypothetical protein
LTLYVLSALLSFLISLDAYQCQNPPTTPTTPVFSLGGNIWGTDPSSPELPPYGFPSWEELTTWDELMAEDALNDWYLAEVHGGVSSSFV